ncbi:dihydroorotase [Agromyces aerolatus]|uniref:dihydroorotase n=1 Tax=Agromyces sp. LY-1074 TaxID=3074080 RepID=UPI00285E7D61|nr:MULTISPECIES: dihydroorotase [unclassified Agromyces]MDR5700926.1 dihydroorotase [Agromyces sp. LY-1074]MDR5707413.1 dihydroorotase [Agromyces sp. LY-1358]
MTSQLIENVRVRGAAEPVDVTVDGGRIVRIAATRAAEPCTRVLLPGFVDMHTHLREPGGEHAETIQTGTAAAAAGGYTDVFAMANTNPVTDTLGRVHAMRRLAERASARVHVVAAATVGQQGREIVDVPTLRGAGVRMFSDDGRCVDDDGVALRVLEAVAEFGGVFAQHAQSATIVGSGVVNLPVAEIVGCAGWPGVGEEAIIARDIAIARATGGRLHVCHVSTARSVDLIRWAKSIGAPVTAEVTPHHLTLFDTDAAERGPALKVNPPLRSAEDVRALRAALLDGTIDVIGTDHAPHPAETKAGSWADAAFGMTAIETALPVVAEVLTVGGRTDWTRLVEVMSARPAQITGLAENSVEIGAAADFTVIEDAPGGRIDLDTHLSRSANSPFSGFPATHRVALTVLDGRVTYSR